MIISHIYQVFSCKTKDCAQPHNYRYIGIHGTVNLMALSSPHPFQFLCPKCGKSHTYSHLDIAFEARPDPPQPGEVFLCE